MPSRVEIGARLHFGFLNLALSRSRLYGGIGLALEDPSTIVTAAKADEIVCPDEPAAIYAERVVDLLGVPGAEVRIEEEIPHHVGLGSGTRRALGILLAIADCYGQSPQLRKYAPSLGRGGRSGVGVGTAERGGFVVDAGHATSMFTPEPPDRGEWEVPPIAVHRKIPRGWRFVLIIPEGQTGRSGDEEDDAMRRVVAQADPSIADRIAITLVDSVLPGLATGDSRQFGEGVMTIDRANGEWYADLQGGVYRPPAGQLVDRLRSAAAAHGVGQSSWGPTVWAVSDRGGVEGLAATARDALDDIGSDGTVKVTRGFNNGVQARNV